MTETETRLVCVDLALGMLGIREDLQIRFNEYARFVAGDETRLAALRIAVKHHGNTPRITAAAVVDLAAKYHAMSLPVAPPLTVRRTRRQGGRKA